MALSKKSITGSWQAISSAGEAGFCCVYDTVSYSGKNVVYLTRATSTPDSNSVALRLFASTNNSDNFPLSIDTASDIWYARCKDSDGTASIIVDVA